MRGKTSASGRLVPPHISRIPDQEVPMTRVIAGMTISLDGFVADKEGSLSALYTDFAELKDSEIMRDIIAETGAVLMGRRTFDAAEDPDSYADDYEFQAPIFVLTHHPPAIAPKENDRLTITFVTDGVERAVSQAVAAAGERDVTVVGGASVIHQLLMAGLVDELHIDVMPVFIGEGLRLFDLPALTRVRLETIDAREIGARTALRFRVLADA
jgi:dihydrofolate reductase